MVNRWPVVAMVWEGKGTVKTGRKMLGETNPADSLPGAIRGDYCIDIGRNICHGSDSVETAKKEIALWFKEGELNNYCCANSSWVYEQEGYFNLTLSTLFVFYAYIAGSDICSFCIFVYIVGSDFFFRTQNKFFCIFCG